MRAAETNPRWRTVRPAAMAATAPAGNFADGPHSVMIPRKKKKARQSKKTLQASKEPEKTISFRNYALSDAPVPPEDAPVKVSTAKEVCVCVCRSCMSCSRGRDCIASYCALSLYPQRAEHLAHLVVPSIALT